MPQDALASGTNGNVDTAAPTEATLLLESGRSTESVSDTSSRISTVDQELWDELDRPWPSTFERSISLLASPIVPPRKVASYTRSPKPGSTPIALARRSNLDRGVYTPDRPWAFGRQEHNSDRDENFKQSLNKVQSLDFADNVPDLEAVQKIQAQRLSQAQEYRKKILATAGGTKKKKVKTEKPPKDGKATFLQCSFNLANILMGVGLLGLPYVFKVAGWYGGFLCIFSFSLITWRTSILIGRELNGDPRPSSFFDDSPYKSPLVPGSSAAARMLRPITSFPDIARSAYGETGCAILSAILYFELFSCISIFFVSMGDHLHQLFPSISVTTHMCIACGISLVPTIILKTPTLLSYFSMVGTFATFSVVLAVIASAFLEGDIAEKVAMAEAVPEPGPYHIGWRVDGLALAFGLVAYCFSGHAIVPSIYTSMERPQEFEKMVTLTFLLVTASCAAVAVSGYYVFGSTVQDQVTLSLEHSSKAVVAMKALTCLMIMTAFSKLTLTMYPLALGFEEIVTPYLTSESLVDVTAAVIKLVLTVLALLVSIFVPSFSFLCALVGMICTMAVSVIFPAGAYLKLFGSRLPLHVKILDWFIVFVGVVMAVVGTVATVA